MKMPCELPTAGQGQTRPRPLLTAKDRYAVWELGYKETMQILRAPENISRPAAE